MSKSSKGQVWVKFESKSNRVKGLSFHPRRPWILASLHNGTIQLWDYQREIKIDQFEEHEGPVRGVHFHNSQPLFVSGGDDYKIKVWNYQQRRCLFNLLGHLDYLRTVRFHHEYPWILSASDDQTIRIWNWQSRQQLAVLTGHNHYCMSADFHPKEDLIVSASLDQTVRVWDFSGLRKKTVSIAGEGSPTPSGTTPSMGYGGAPGSSGDKGADLFGGTDVVVKHVLEGHTRGVNWASFNKNLSLIVSGADDREVKLWRMTDTKCWEVDRFTGHVNNVSCVIFHPKRELIISNSEDKSIRVWDMSKTGAPLVLRRENDRYWILDAHPTNNLVAAGHDSGFVVFKLNRERPALDANKQLAYYYKDLYVYEHNMATGKERPVLSTRRRTQPSLTPVPQGPRTLAYNWANKLQHCILLTYDVDQSYELYVFGKDDKGNTGVDAESMAMKGYGRSAVFVSRNRFAVLDKQRQIQLRTLKNEVKKSFNVPGFTVTYMFDGGLGRLLLRTPEYIILYDIQAMKILKQLHTPTRFPIKYAVWSADRKYLALFSKQSIFVTNGELDELCTINENVRIKSGAWDAQGVFVYTTAMHVKYLLPNGDNGLIKTLEQPVYLTGVASSTIFYIDRQQLPGKTTVDATEYSFKAALWRKKHKEALRLMSGKRLLGKSLVAYLQKKGYPEVALHFVEDDRVKFALALECGNIRVALETATKLDDPECWHKLGVEALRQGNMQVVEASYQKSKNFDRLSSLYLYTGDLVKLRKMLQIANLRGDVQARFHNAMYLGDVQERVNALKDAGQLQFAYITAKTHGLTEQAEELAAMLDGKVPEVKEGSAKLFVPPTPILKEASWPVLATAGGFFDTLDEEHEGPEEKAAPTGDDLTGADFEDADTDGVGAAGEGWGDMLLYGDGKKKDGDAAAGGGWDDLDIKVGGSTEDETEAGAEDADGKDDYFVMPLPGTSASQRWSSTSPLAADLAASGNFEMAMHVLNKQIGVANFEPLRQHMLTIYRACHSALPSQLPSSDALMMPLYRLNDEKKQSDLPQLPITLATCDDLLREAYKAMVEGAVDRTLQAVVDILHALPFVVVESKAKVAEIEELVGICREYATAARIELLRRASAADPVKQATLAAYFTHCKLQPVHLVFGLKVAIKTMLTIKNKKSAAGFCRRLLELAMTNANSPIVQKYVDRAQITKLLKDCEKTPVDEKPLDYDDTAVFVLDCDSFGPIVRGKPSVRCPYCVSHYKPELDGSLCRTCRIARIGTEASGLRSHN